VPGAWSGVDPASAGIELVIDHATASEQVDVAIPGGASWSVNGSGTRWVYKDSSGAVAGITRASVRYDASVQPGLLKLTAKGTGPQPLSIPG
jgi:hypothetical protein